MTEWGQSFAVSSVAIAVSAPVAGYEGQYTMRYLLLHIL